MLKYDQTPIQEIRSKILSDADIKLFIKREDLNHPFVSGNKWWKLKYNLAECLNQKKHTILTFGGAFSNHIYSTAAAAQEVNLRCIGIIRGEETSPLNSTLYSAAAMGMKIHYVSRELYRNKSDEIFMKDLRRNFGDFFLIPEGGSNDLAVQGVQEFVNGLDFDFDYICCPVGTGGTLAGIIRALKGSKKIVGFSSLKNGSFLYDEVRKFPIPHDNWVIQTEYDYGGYAKSTPALLEFIGGFTDEHKIPLEHVYTGKMMSGIFDLVQKGFFSSGSVVLAIHTGGIRPVS